ncbi:small acid-soluble spore protein Tlp [Bacillus sp. SG-1]|uniref:small acid-soluble spore protein Tlp n=1 Tax=Bacillus sp. SG-1 TaxID=161544 RepID=UPI00015441ED|nr:small acid-soluble spore protein Tlp [Bacillus sp. SG-1]EDL65757.1 small acid-soluble spore protein Tlp [Bacillus sp. SG-1]
MAEYKNRPNPDDRSDNVDKLQSMVFHTIQNMERAEESMAMTDSDEQKQAIEAKNDRRRESIDAFRSELKDEAAYQRNGQDDQYK